MEQSIKAIRNRKLETLIFNHVNSTFLVSYIEFLVGFKFPVSFKTNNNVRENRCNLNF
ncbi:hypothetical protein JM82_2116 [Olleya sp. Hel_I_94]|nr:hypothetical protein JM82_2116 [Olleya sp. Hel_I_94]